MRTNCIRRPYAAGSVTRQVDRFDRPGTYSGDRRSPPPQRPSGHLGYLRGMGVWEPVYQAASAALLTRESGEVLMVASPYRSDLVLPGGVVEEDESPASAAEREVAEETGLDVSVSRLLVVQHLQAEGNRTSSLRFVFDCAPVPPGVVLRPQDAEVSELLWLSPAEATAKHAARGRRRLAVALEARVAGTTVYLDDRGVLPAAG